MTRKIAPIKLHPTMSVRQFDHGYWYATEIRAFAKQIGMTRVTGRRKDELEDVIRHYLRTGKIQTLRRPAKRQRCDKDSARPLTMTRRVVHYTNDNVTKAFLERQRQKLVPGQPHKSGAMYRLNRWREQQLAAGYPLTYGDVVRKYAELSDTDGAFPQARSGRYINFLSDFLRYHQNGTRRDAIGAWHELKTLDIPKTYAAWKKWQACGPRP